MVQKKELDFMRYIPKPEQDYIMSFNESDSTYILLQLGKSTEEYLDCQKLINILKSIVVEYNKAIDTLMDIDMECNPEMYGLQEKLCETLTKLYYSTKNESYSCLSHLDIYNLKIPGMTALWLK